MIGDCSRGSSLYRFSVREGDFKPQSLITDDFDIIAVLETWAKEEITDAELAADEYVLFRKDRKNGDYTKRGGVALYIQHILKSQVCVV